MRNNKGQMAIFIVVAIILVVGIVLLVYLRSNNKIGATTASADNVEQYIGKCVRDSAQTALDRMIPQGGFVAPTDYKTYQDVNAAYICKNVNYYEPCINQYPQYIHSVEAELAKEVNKKLTGCFTALSDELKRKNYDVSYSAPQLNVTIKPDNVYTQVLTQLRLVKGGQTQNYDHFDVSLRSPAYLLVSTAQLIASQEAQYCYFEYVGYSLLHPEVTVTRFTMSDATKVYTIKDTKTGMKMYIATKGCAIPAGF